MYGRSLAHERFKIREFEGKYKKQIKNYAIMVVIHLKKIIRLSLLMIQLNIINYRYF